MVGDVWAITGMTLNPVQDLGFWNPGLLRTTEFDDQWDALEFVARAGCLEHRCTPSEDAIRRVDWFPVLTKNNLEVVIASEGPPGLPFRYNPPIFFAEPLPCEQ